MNEKTALIFPGMGPSSFAAVGKFMVLDPYVRRLLPIADAALGYSLLDRFYESEEEYSEYTQVAFLVNSLALAHRAEEELGMRPDYCVGPSFGQKAAAVWTGSLDFPDVVRMTAELARDEQEYFATEHADVVTHSVMRVPEHSLDEYLSQLAEQGHWYEISGRLDEGFFMVSLSARLLADFKESVSAMGGYSMATMRPPVHARAFHGLRRRAADAVFPRYGVRAPEIPVIADQDGRVVETAEDMRGMLLDTFDVPIDWPAVVNSLVNLGVRTVFVTGPENLFRRVQCTVRNFEVIAVDPKNTLKKMLRPVRSSSPRAVSP